MSLTKARILVYRMGGTPVTYNVQFNPETLKLEKTSQLAEIAIPGLDTPVHQFVRGQTEKLTVQLVFDTSDSGTGEGATSVTQYSDRIYQLVKIEPNRHAPPVCEFHWGEAFPGDAVGAPPTIEPPTDLGEAAAIAAAAALAATAVAAQIASGPGGGNPAAIAAATGITGAVAGGAAVGAVAGLAASALTAPPAIPPATNPLANQQRHCFKGIAESVSQEYTLFSSEGTPLRAKLTLVLREYKTLSEQFTQLNLNSPDKTQIHPLQEGETLALIAARHYGDASYWRLIARANGLDDPRRLTPGQFVRLPPVGGG